MTALLFCDFETTSLDVKTLTALEFAWTITDLDGIQRCPIKHRYMALSANTGTMVYPVKKNAEKARWHNSSLRSNESEMFARRMAEDSLLFSDWLTCPSEHILRSDGELERLILDDLYEFCGQGSEVDATSAETVHICGAGAARFDFSILQSLCPRVLPVEGKLPVHYRPVDTSGNQTGLLGGNAELEVIKWYMEKYGEDACRIWLDSVPSNWYRDDVPMAWLIGERGLHRSVPDVARSVVVQRALWVYGEPLRKALDVRATA